MDSERISRITFYVLSLVIPIMALYNYHNLPLIVASHFNFKGKVDSWMTRESFTITSVGLPIFVALIFSLISFIIKKIPEKFINLPNKEYWLADERKAETKSVLSSYLYWMGCLTLGLLIVSFYQVNKINLSGETSLGLTTLYCLIPYIGAMILLVIKMITRFTNK